MKKDKETWPDRGAAIIPYGNKIILMRRERIKDGRKSIYYTIPGGGQEIDETIQETTIRELKEEIGIDIKIREPFFSFKTAKRKQYIFLGEYVSGKFGSGDGEEFTKENFKEFGAYIPELITREALKRIKLVPYNLKRKILREFSYITGKVTNNNIVKKVDKNKQKKKYKSKYTENLQNNKKSKVRNINVDKNNVNKVNKLKKYGKKKYIK